MFLLKYKKKLLITKQLHSKLYPSDVILRAIRSKPLRKKNELLP